ncbi:MAG: hypothetical protein IH937_03330 [Acidobacteria bacterium]|nr:hypothetical protein [Acidobacteriota bacterium]
MPAGAPLGNTNAARGFKATQALEKAVYRLSSGDETPCGDYEEVLVQIWVKAIEKAKDDGDMQALNAIMDRLEGKPRQSVDIGGQPDNPIGVEEVRRTLVKPESVGHTDS